MARRDAKNEQGIRTPQNKRVIRILYICIVKKQVVSFVGLGALGLLLLAACYPPNGSRAASAVRVDTIAHDPDTGMADTFRAAVLERYNQTRLASSQLDTGVFAMAYTGYLNLRAAGRTNSAILTIVDFNLPSTAHRMWIIDTDRDSLLLNTWSAHGEGSGREKATTFSNTPGSLQTSLGFYLTAEEYIGKNGRSLRIDGLDEGFNTNARRRYVVMHGADYVSQDTIDALGYLGNSEGCPAVSHAVNHQVIDWVKGGSVLFITGPSADYHSVWLNREKARLYLLGDEAD